MGKFIEDKPTKASSSETVTDLTSMRSLNEELREYWDRTNNGELHELYPGVERMEYDFTVERQSIHATNLVESTANLIKGCLGAGILGIHEGYMFGGLWASLAANVIIGFILPHNMLLLVNSAQEMYRRLRVPRLSYPDLVEATVATGPLICCRRFSKFFRYTIDFFLFFGFCSTCCIFEIMIAQTLKELMESVSTTFRNWQLTKTVYILVIAVPLLLISMIRSLKHLAPFSIVADLFCGLCILITVYYSILERKGTVERPAWKSVRGFFRFCGVCIYSIDGMGVALPIENYMAKPQYFYIVVQWGMSVVFLSVASVGFFGYLAWGDDCKSPITRHMPKNGTSIILQFLLVATLGVTFSVHLWVPFRTIWHYIGKRHKSTSIILQFLLVATLGVTFSVHLWVPFRTIWHYIGKRHKRHRGIWERFYKGIYVAIITCFSIIFSDLSQWMSFVGNFFLGTIVFIFPAFINSLVIWKKSSPKSLRLKLLRNAVIFMIGVTLCCGGIYAYKIG